MLDKYNKDTYFFVDEYGMMLAQNPSWEPNGDFGKDNSIGRTFQSYIAYRDKSFINAIKTCFKVQEDEKGVYLQAYRHPTFIDIEYNDMSRDHIVTALLSLKHANEDIALKMYSKLLRWKISDRYTFTFDLWLWMKGISGNKLAMISWYWVSIPVMLLSVLLNKIIQLLAWPKFNEVSHEDYHRIYGKNKDVPEYYKKLRKYRYPTYALHLQCWKNYVTKPSIGRWLMKQVLKLDVGKYNYLLRMLTNMKVKKEDIYSWQMMSGNRWSTRTDLTNDRGLGIIDDPDDKLLVANNVEIQMIRNIYKTQINL